MNNIDKIKHIRDKQISVLRTDLNKEKTQLRLVKIHTYLTKHPGTTKKQLIFLLFETDRIVSKYLKIRRECQDVINSIYTS